MFLSLILPIVFFSVLVLPFHQNQSPREVANTDEDSMTNSTSLDFENFDESFDATEYCPNCQSILDNDCKFCPFCGTELQKQCSNCQNRISQDWKYCPYCGNNQKSSFIDPNLGPSTSSNLLT